MEPVDLAKEVPIKITLGHLIFAWRVMSDKFGDLRSHEQLSEVEKRAIWGLADLLENSLIEAGITELPEVEWHALITQAREFMNTVPVDFLD